MSHEYCLTWDEFHRDTLTLTRRLLAREPFQGIIAIARGGLIPAGILAREMNLRFVDTLCIASYDHTQQGSLRLLKGVEGHGKGMLVIDDLVDTGTTGLAVRELLPEAYFATVYAKPRGIPTVDTFVREFAQDCWLHFPWDCQFQFTRPLAES